MLKKIFFAAKRHKILTGIIVIALAWGGYYAYGKINQTAAQTSYVLAAAEKGMLIVSVSGSGQVSAKNQIDIKPKASGDVIYVGVKSGQEVKSGSLIVQINSSDAQRAVTDAQLALDSAKIKLDELTQGADALDLRSAQNAINQAERDLEKARDTYENIGAETEKTLKDASENGYNEVSDSLFKLSDYINDLQDVMGTDSEPEKYLNAYKLILSNNSPYIQNFADDYYEAAELYDKNVVSFRQTSINSDHQIIYNLINETLETAKTISRALESARHMFDVITTTAYKKFNVASQIDMMQPKIKNDVSAAAPITASLDQFKETVDDAIADTPGKIKDARLALEFAEEKLEDKKIAFKELQDGADEIDVKNQQNTVAQKEAALFAAKADLADHFIRAPFDGVIASADVQKGDPVSAGTILAKLITKQRVAEISLNEIDAAKIKTGQKATLAFDAIEDLNITGQVVEIDTLGTVTQGVVSYSAKIAFDTQDERIKPGMSVSASIITEAKQNVILVPNSSVKTNGNDSYVEILDQPQITLSASVGQSVTSLTAPRQIAVTIGLSNDDSTEIISGLEEGDEIISRTITAASQATTQNASNLIGGTGGGNVIRFQGGGR